MKTLNASTHYWFFLKVNLLHVHEGAQRLDPLLALLECSGVYIMGSRVLNDGHMFASHFHWYTWGEGVSDKVNLRRHPFQKVEFVYQIYLLKRMQFLMQMLDLLVAVV